jgi:hypothetical protein
VEHFESQTILATAGTSINVPADEISIPLTWLQTEACSQNIQLQGTLVCPNGEYNLTLGVNGYFLNV